jgi:hypothetical protein
VVEPVEPVEPMELVELVQPTPTISIDLLCCRTSFEEHVFSYFFHFLRSTIQKSVALVIVTPLSFLRIKVHKSIKS